MTAEEMLWEYGGDILRSPTMDQERTIPPVSYTHLTLPTKAFV